MQLTSYGAAETVTGSKHLLTLPSGKLLLDCGMFQGPRDEAAEKNAHLPSAIVSADAMILSHAHIDHSGAIPMLVKAGFRGLIYTTPATYDIVKLTLLDAAQIQMADAAYLNEKKHVRPPAEPLYTTADAEEALHHFELVPYGKWFNPLPGVRARFHDAGHILGSAQIEMEIDVGRGRVTHFGFTGDLGRKHLPILRDPVQMTGLDILLTESTYAARRHDDITQMGDALAEVVNRTVARGGKLIIPAFSVERTQELIYVLHELLDAKKISAALPVFVDSPLATNATEVFTRHRECWDAPTYAEFVEKNEGPFSFKSLRYTRGVEESKRINNHVGPAIIIAASGMCEAGRVLHHLKNNIANAANTVLIVGFQAPATLGRRLVELQPTIRIFGEEYPRRAEIVVLNAFSGHADDPELLSNIEASGAKKVVCVHGDPEAVATMAAEAARLGITSIVQKHGVPIDL